MLHKSALFLGVLCVACPLTAISETSHRETGYWLSAGLARTEVRLPQPPLGGSGETQWDNWQFGAGYDTQSWLDVGVQYDWFRTRFWATLVHLNAVEVRARAKLHRDSSVFLAPVAGVGLGWTSRDEPNAIPTDGSYVPFTYSARGPVATLGADLHIQPGSWLAVVVSGTYRWSWLGVRNVPPGLTTEPDANLEGWSVGIQIRVYPEFSGVN